MLDLVLLAIVLPFVGAAITLVSPPRIARWICVVAAAASLAAVCGAVAVFVRAGRAAESVVLMRVHDVAIWSVTLDRLSLLIGFAVGLVGLFVCVYSLGYMSLANREHPDAGRPRYFFFMQVFIGAMAGLVFSGTLVGQLFFFEITGACSWGLIGYYESRKALSAAAKALVVTHVGSLGLYFAAAMLFARTGSFELSALAQPGDGAKTAILLGILFAAWGKSAQLPLHTWLPNAMEAPTPVSAYLHAGSMVNIGVYIFARAIFSAGPVPHVVGAVGAIAAAITLVYAFAMYFPQADLKRLLVYSTIAQLSYIFLALSLSIFGSPSGSPFGSSLAFEGGVAHIFNHAFAKSLFFLVSGSLSYATGTRMLPLLRGILVKLPLVGICFGIAALAIAGVPPMNLFFSKFAIFAGGFEVASHYAPLVVLVLLLIAESVGTFVWFLRKFNFSVLGPPSPAVASAQPLPTSVAVALIGLAILTVCSGFVPLAWLG